MEAEQEQIQKAQLMLWGKIGIIVIACAVMIYQFMANSGSEIPEYTLDRSSPEDVAAYCGQNLQSYLVPGEPVDINIVSEYCVPPLKISTAGNKIIVRSPGNAEYGFSELEIDLTNNTLSLVNLENAGS